MKPMSDKKKTALRNNALGFAKHCPVDGSNPEDCPLHGVRKLGPARSCQWIGDLSGDDLGYLNAYHAVCEQIRMESRDGQNPPPPAPRLYAEENKDGGLRTDDSAEGEAV